MTEEKEPEKQFAEKKEEPRPPVKDEIVTTQHSAMIGGQLIEYSISCGTIVLKEESEGKGEKAGEAEGEKPRASVFFVAYTQNDVDDRNRRPITFSFNGGPGSSSVWLHLGAIGPRRVLMGDAGNLLPPPWKLGDNQFSLLDVTDLVFIDPVGTGYSRAALGGKASEFHTFKKDIESVGDFIRLYVSRNHRWASPKFMVGESYGTTRAAGLSGYLQDRHGMYLNGLMLISSILNFQGYEFEPGNDLPFITHLPTYAATAWYHHRLPAVMQQKELRAFLDEVEEFASGDYAQALWKGAGLSAEERSAIAQRLARFTGLSPDYLERTDLRINIFRFTKELIRDQRRTVGRLDTRFLGIDRDAAGENFEHDPSMSAIMGPYTAAFNQYVRGDLKFESDLPYEILSSKVSMGWSFSDHENKYVDVSETLRHALAVNPFLKVYVANGYYDLATPYFATKHTFSHLSLDPALAANISLDYFEAGHMMYVHLPSLEKLKAGLEGFIRSTL